MHVHNEIDRFARQHPSTTIAISILLVVGAILVTLRNYFKPIGLRHPKARLPHGPKGVFLLGSLLRLREREDPQHTLVFNPLVATL